MIWGFSPQKYGGRAYGSYQELLDNREIDLIQFLSAQTIVETTSELFIPDKCNSNGNLINADDNAFCIYRLKNGIVGLMTARLTYCEPEDNSIVLYGKKGIMRIYDDPFSLIKVNLYNGEKVRHGLENIQINDNRTKSGVIDLFVDSILNDRETDLSGKVALSAMRAVFAITESSEKGRKIFVKQD